MNKILCFVSLSDIENFLLGIIEDITYFAVRGICIFRYRFGSRYQLAQNTFVLDNLRIILDI